MIFGLVDVIHVQEDMITRMFNMNRRVISLPKNDAKKWLLKNNINPTDELVVSLAKELKEFFDIGADN